MVGRITVLFVVCPEMEAQLWGWQMDGAWSAFVTEEIPPQLALKHTAIFPFRTLRTQNPLHHHLLSHPVSKAAPQQPQTSTSRHSARVLAPRVNSAGFE